MDISEFSPHTGRYIDESSVARNIIEHVTGAVKIITSDHANIHASEGYSISGIFTSVGNGATVNYAFKTPTVASGKIIHWKYSDIFINGTKARSDIYEAPTDAPINGTDLAPINRRRIAPIRATAMQAVKTAMDITTAGAIILDSRLFSNSAGGRPIDIELELEANTWYIRTFTNLTGGAADVSFFEFWYEEEEG
jgi:uncharacterized Fe-S center protein